MTIHSSTTLGRGRALMFVLALLFTGVSARSQRTIRSLTDVINGHSVGGVTVNAVDVIYVADFVKDNKTLETRLTSLAERSLQLLSATGLLRSTPELVILDPTRRSRLRWFN